MQGSERFNECLLGDIFSFRRIVHVPHDQLQHLVLVSQDQQIERRALTALDSLHEFQITLFDTHE
jgi:hypothetical protein